MEGEFEIPTQEAVRSSSSFGDGGSKGKEQDKSHACCDGVQSTQTMLQGKVRSALSWVTESEKGGVLAHDDRVPSKDSHGNPSVCSVRKVLKQKHPASKEPGIEAMHNYDFPPPLMPGLDLMGKSVVPWEKLRALRANCLISFDKCPGEV
jgi:hypothetical protein